MTSHICNICYEENNSMYNTSCCKQEICDACVSRLTNNKCPYCREDIRYSSQNRTTPLVSVHVPIVRLSTGTCQYLITRGYSAGERCGRIAQYPDIDGYLNMCCSSHKNKSIY